jgi:ubiquinol-cytochrome c reductase cytochrome b/c1 subunit
VPFTPYATMKDAFGDCLLHAVLRWFVFYGPNYLGHADNYIPANPLVTPAHIVPEWYYLPFYAILRAIPDKLGGVIAMFGSIGYLGSKPAESTYLFWARVCTFWYFFHFIVILPLLGLLESPKPLPASISDDVLSKSKNKLAPAE